MFTINTQWALGKSGVRWESNVSEQASQMHSSNTDAKIQEVKKLLKEIDDSIFTHKAEFEKLKLLLADIETENIQVSKNIDKAIVDALRSSTLSTNEKKDIEALQGERTQKRTALDTALANARNTVTTVRKVEEKEFLKDNYKLDKLSNLDGNSIISDTEKDFVGEKALKQAISKAAGVEQKDLDAVYQRVVGAAPDWNVPSVYADFQNALRVQVSIVREMTG